MSVYLVASGIVLYFVLGLNFIESRILDRDTKFFKSLKKFFKEITFFDLLKSVLFIPVIICAIMIFSMGIPMLFGVAYIIFLGQEIKKYLCKSKSI